MHGSSHHPEFPQDHSTCERDSWRLRCALHTETRGSAMILWQIRHGINWQKEIVGSDWMKCNSVWSNATHDFWNEHLHLVQIPIQSSPSWVGIAWNEYNSAADHCKTLKMKNGRMCSTETEHSLGELHSSHTLAWSNSFPSEATH